MIDCEVMFLEHLKNFQTVPQHDGKHGRHPTRQHAMMNDILHQPHGEEALRCTAHFHSFQRYVMH